MTADSTELRLPHIMLVAGEPSGDALGEQLMGALKELTNDRIKITGVGGEGMTALGLNSLFSLDDTAVMGLREVVPKIPLILRRVRETADYAEREQPDAVVLIDAPDFTHRIGRMLAKRRSKIKVIKYVAPQVWASRPKRAETLGGFIHHLLALLPFEPEFFESHGLATTFVGHPVIERAGRMQGGDAFLKKHNIADDKTVLGVLPGSRSNELRFLLPVFKEAVEQLAKTHHNLHTVMPTVPHVADRLNAETKDWPTPLTIVRDGEGKFASFDALDLALAASGTVSTELALSSTPTVIAYRVGRLTAAIARRMINVPFVSLVNIIQEKEVFPEFIQDDCTPAALASALENLLTNDQACEEQVREMAMAVQKLGLGKEKPSLRAAQAILDVIEYQS